MRISSLRAICNISSSRRSNDNVGRDGSEVWFFRGGSSADFGTRHTTVQPIMAVTLKNCSSTTHAVTLKERLGVPVSIPVVKSNSLTSSLGDSVSSGNVARAVRIDGTVQSFSIGFRGRAMCGSVSDRGTYDGVVDLRGTDEGEERYR